MTIHQILLVNGNQQWEAAATEQAITLTPKGATPEHVKAITVTPDNKVIYGDAKLATIVHKGVFEYHFIDGLVVSTTHVNFTFGVYAQLVEQCLSWVESNNQLVRILGNGEYFTLEKLMANIQTLTYDVCKTSCRSMGSCCSSQQCADAKYEAEAMYGIKFSYDLGADGTYLVDGKCQVPPQFRVSCTYHQCDISSLGIFKNDLERTNKYFDLRDGAEDTMYNIFQSLSNQQQQSQIA